MFDYETIRLIWWVFIGVVAIAFAVTEASTSASARCCRSSARPTSNAGW